MSDYTQITDFSTKDALTSGDPEKVILGSDVDGELAAIATAIATKANSTSVPVLSSNNLFTTIQTIISSGPGIRLNETDQAVDEKEWSIDVANSDFVIRTRSDAHAAGTDALRLFRGTGNTADAVELLGMRIDADTYTPTITNTTNIDSTTAGLGFYQRIGDIVIVEVPVLINTTTTGVTVIGVSLPIASDLAAATDLSGLGSAPHDAGPDSGHIVGDLTNNRATYTFYENFAGDITHRLRFSYRVL